MKVSIIFSARNEAPQVRTALQSMLSQDYPNYEVIAINDRSEDETLSILNSFTDLRLKVLNIQELPPNWLGKNHALYQGARISDGDWLLFTDADVHFEPGALTAAMHVLTERMADHLVVFPKMVCKRWIEAVFTGAFIMAFFRRFRPWMSYDDKPENYVGVGAFNMVRRKMYENAGTHEKIAMDVLDDLHLGRLVKACGGRQLAVCGTDFVSVQWVKDWKGVLLSLEKNAFAGFDYKVRLMIAATFAGILIDILPFFTLFLPQTFLPSLLIVLCIAASYLAIQKVNSCSFLAFFTHPIGLALILVLMWRSALKVLKEGGVTWRGTFYSLDQLRAYSKI